MRLRKTCIIVVSASCKFYHSSHGESHVHCAPGLIESTLWCGEHLFGHKVEEVEQDPATLSPWPTARIFWLAQSHLSPFSKMVLTHHPWGLLVYSPLPQCRQWYCAFTSKSQGTLCSWGLVYFNWDMIFDCLSIGNSNKADLNRLLRDVVWRPHINQELRLRRSPKCSFQLPLIAFSLWWINYSV